MIERALETHTVRAASSYFHTARRPKTAAKCAVFSGERHSRANHCKHHFKFDFRRKPMRRACGHSQRFARPYNVPFAAQAYDRLALQNLHEGVERRSVFAKTLPPRERKKRDCAVCALYYLPTGTARSLQGLQLLPSRRNCPYSPFVCGGFIGTFAKMLRAILRLLPKRFWWRRPTSPRACALPSARRNM